MKLKKEFKAFNEKSLFFKNIGSPDHCEQWRDLKVGIFHVVCPSLPSRPLIQKQLMKWIECNRFLFTKNSNNYTEDLYMEKHLIFTLGLDLKSHNLIGFSGVYNGGRYPEGVYRVFNRTFTNPHYRVYGKVPVFHSQCIFPHHFYYLKAHAKALFLSREGFAEKSIRAICRSLKTITNTDWIQPKGFYKVASGKKKANYQKTAYTLLNGASSFPLTAITDKAYLKLN